VHKVFFKHIFCVLCESFVAEGVAFEWRPAALVEDVAAVDVLLVLSQ
jgi:hypothetical protein